MIRPSQNARSSGPRQIHLLRSLEEARQILPVWERMHRSSSPLNPAVHPEIYFSEMKSAGADVEPYILLPGGNGRPEAMLVGRRMRHAVSCKVGYLDLLKPSLRCIFVDYGGLLGSYSDDVCRQVIDHLGRQLRTTDVQAVIFNHLRIDSLMYRLLNTSTCFHLRSHLPKVNAHWSMSLPEDMPMFYKRLSPKNRSSLKRYLKKLEQNHNIRVADCSGAQALPGALSDAAGISSLTYQHRLDSGLVDDAATLDRLLTAAGHDLLCLHLMYVDDRPAAFQLGLKYQRTYYLQQMGFDPALGRLHVGTALFLKILERLCADPRLDRLDFGFGDAEYKRRYGDTRWSEATAYLFAPRPYPLAVNAARCLARGMSLSMQRLASKTGVESRLKRRWRNLLQNSGSKRA